MQIQKHLTVALLLACLNVCSYAHEETIQPQPKKMYVDSRKVMVTKEGIFISTNKGLIRVKNLQSNGQGLFITEKQLQKAGYYGQYCRGCGRYFESLGKEDYCPQCRKERRHR